MKHVYQSTHNSHIYLTYKHIYSNNICAEGHCYIRGGGQGRIWGIVGRVRVSKGEAHDQGRKFRRGGGYGRGCPPSLCGRKLKLETV